MLFVCGIKTSEKRVAIAKFKNMMCIMKVMTKEWQLNEMSDIH